MLISCTYTMLHKSFGRAKNTPPFSVSYSFHCPFSKRWNTYARTLSGPLQCWDVIAKLRGYNNIAKGMGKSDSNLPRLKDCAFHLYVSLIQKRAFDTHLLRVGSRFSGYWVTDAVGIFLSLGVVMYYPVHSRLANDHIRRWYTVKVCQIFLL